MNGLNDSGEGCESEKRVLLFDRSAFGREGLSSDHLKPEVEGSGLFCCPAEWVVIYFEVGGIWHGSSSRNQDWINVLLLLSLFRKEVEHVFVTNSNFESSLIP